MSYVNAGFVRWLAISVTYSGQRKLMENSSLYNRKFEESLQRIIQVSELDTTDIH
jgi:hypothetical protein